MSKLKCLCGYHGSGKTNLAINLAINSARKGNKVILVDCDLGDPYFRPISCKETLEQYGVELISPVSADTTLSLPILPREFYSIFTKTDKEVFIDVGDSEHGIKLLNRFYKEFEKRGYELMFVMNFFRLLHKSINSTIQYARFCEDNSSLKLSSIINNSHLKDETTSDDIIEAYDYVKDVANKLDIPIKMNTVPSKLLTDIVGKIPKLYPIDNYIDYVWET